MPSGSLFSAPPRFLLPLLSHLRMLRSLSLPFLSWLSFCYDLFLFFYRNNLARTLVTEASHSAAEADIGKKVTDAATIRDVSDCVGL